MEETNYKRVILPQAESDIKETLDYIAEKLFNPTAAVKLIEKMEETMQSISLFPYSRSKLNDERLTLGMEYRRAEVDNFVLIYKVRCLTFLNLIELVLVFYNLYQLSHQCLNHL